MSEQNILNPAIGSLMSPDYNNPEQLPDMFSRKQARSGGMYVKRLQSLGRTIEMVWNNRPQSVADALRQWEAQYESDYFTFADYDRARYYTGMFSGPLVYTPAGYNKISVKGTFIEIPGLAMYQSPTNWDRDAVLFGVRRSDGSDRWKLSATDWTYRNDNLYTKTPASCYIASTLNASAECEYYGYGFRLWYPTNPDRGIINLYLDGVLQAALDQYTAGGVNSSARYTAAARLGMHRVKIVISGKNAASSAQNVIVDTIEVMR